MFTRFYGFNKTPWEKVTWRRKGQFVSKVTIIMSGNKGRHSRQETEGRKLIKRPRVPSVCLLLHDRTTYQGMAQPSMNWVLTYKSLINNVLLTCL